MGDVRRDLVLRLSVEERDILLGALQTADYATRHYIKQERVSEGYRAMRLQHLEAQRALEQRILELESSYVGFSR